MGKAEVEVLDVSDAAAVKRTAERILGRHGRVDVLVNSAGLNNPQRFWRDQTVDSWDQVIRINLDGTFYCTQAVIPAMRNRKDGLVINISSWAGKYTSAMVGAAYNGSKAAVVSLTETINMEECINGIRACAICPAEVATPILDRRPVPPSAEERAKMLQPVDLGNAIRWVAEQPATVCVNELIISPTWNRLSTSGHGGMRIVTGSKFWTNQREEETARRVGTSKSRLASSEATSLWLDGGRSDVRSSCWMHSSRTGSI